MRVLRCRVMYLSKLSHSDLLALSCRKLYYKLAVKCTDLIHNFLVYESHNEIKSLNPKKAFYGSHQVVKKNFQKQVKGIKEKNYCDTSLRSTSALLKKLQTALTKDACCWECPRGEEVPSPHLSQHRLLYNSSHKS